MCLWFAATLTNRKPFENVFNKVNLFRQKVYVTVPYEVNISWKLNGFQKEQQIRFQEAGISTKWNVFMKQLTRLQITYGYKLIFLCLILIREMRKYCCIESLFETFPKVFIWKFHLNITNQSASFEKGVDFKG